ncbi:MAG: hypothetical protein VXW22_01355 [Pseudomonadota bacterium]|nr:hypothetical protein [Pseudomonadota bacterium]
MPTHAAKLKQRLSGYWKLEAGNVVLMPVFLSMLTGWAPSWVSWLSFAPMIFLLAIGALYWRSKLKQLESRTYDPEPVLGVLSLCQVPALALTLLATGVVMYGWREPEMFNGWTDQGVATFAAILSVLEYINYYHRQLQHFDHGPDFKRLVAGKGLRRSQLAKDLDTFRRTRRDEDS